MNGSWWRGNHGLGQPCHSVGGECRDVGHVSGYLLAIRPGERCENAIGGSSSSSRPGSAPRTQPDKILTGNGNGYRSFAWRDLCAELGIKHRRTRPYHPATNGKVERFDHTLLDEWAYARLWRSETSRARALDRFLHTYNHHRHHTAISGPPASRVTNLTGHNN